MLIRCNQLNFGSELQIHCRQYNFSNELQICCWTHNVVANVNSCKQFDFGSELQISAANPKFVVGHTIQLRQQILNSLEETQFDIES